MHFLLIVKITLPVLVCTDVLTLDVPIFVGKTSFISLTGTKFLMNPR